MAYTQNTWANGDTITAAKLNNLEAGVQEAIEAAASGGGGGAATSDELWKPSVDTSGNLSWTKSTATTPPGTVNIMGPQGEAGIGVPAGGAAGQMLAKATGTDYDTVWIDSPEDGGGSGTTGENGATFTPDVSEDGTLSWTNDKGLTNPEPVNIMGAPGKDAPQIDDDAVSEDSTWSSKQIDTAKLTWNSGTFTGMTGQTANTTISVWDFLSALASKCGNAAYISLIWDVESSSYVTDGNLTVEINGGILLFAATGAATTPLPASAWQYAEAVYFPMASTAVVDKIYKFVGRVSGTAGTIDIEKIYEFQGQTTSDGSEPEPASHIYGATWDGTSTTKWTRTDGAAGFTDPVPYVAGASSYGSPFDNLQPWAGMVKSERTGGTMVSIPKFYYKLTQTGSEVKVQVADGPVEGFSVAPAHMDRGDGKGERDVVYIGRYHCAASTYKSTTGVKPQANVTRAYFRTNIHNLGSTIWQNDFAMRFTLWLLYIVEFADWNSQATIGKGCGDTSATGNMGYTDSMPYHTGTTQSNRDTYGLGTQYRNIEGLWDNVYDWCDGCYNNSNGLNIILNPNSFSDSSGGTSVGTPSNGRPGAFTVKTNGGFPLFIPTATGGGETTYSCDNWNFSASSPCVYVGGCYDQSGLRGLFCVYCGTASYAHAYIGSRLQELP